MSEEAPPHLYEEEDDDTDEPLAVVTAPSDDALPRRLDEWPDDAGWFGSSGGPGEAGPLADTAAGLLEGDTAAVLRNRGVWAEIAGILGSLTARATPLIHAERLSELNRSAARRDMGASIWLKREDLAGAGGASIAIALGHVHLASRAGRRAILCDGSDRDHAMACAVAAGRLDLGCRVFRSDGEDDPWLEQRLRLLGAEVIHADRVDGGLTAAQRAWIEDSANTHYVPSRPVGPHPFPLLAGDLCAPIGRELKGQCLRLIGELPSLIAVDADGPATPGALRPFLMENDTRLVSARSPGRESEAVIAPEVANWRDAGRFDVVAVSDQERDETLVRLSRTDGIVISRASARQLAVALCEARELPSTTSVVVLLQRVSPLGSDEDLGDLPFDLPIERPAQRQKPSGKGKRRKRGGGPSGRSEDGSGPASGADDGQAS